jgi:hypothetical protein
MRVNHAPPPACQKMTAISAQINADRKKAPALGKRLKHNASFLLLWLLLCSTHHQTKTLLRASVLARAKRSDPMDYY